MRRRAAGRGGTLALAAALVVATAAPRPAPAQEFDVDTGAANVVRFISRASIEEFDGVTDRIDGYVLLTEPALSMGMETNDTEFYFEVDLASLDTGIGLRNRHMRDNYLEVKRYPYATFQGALVGVSALSTGGYRVDTTGTLAIHGVEREVRIPCDVSPAGSGYRTFCSFQVRLSDYDIEIPRVMFLKLADEIRLELDFTLRPAGG